ncbi:hypothetical protein BX616_006738 [Lobosporangium transversale]|nr:hypothetical protein BX616_006738 [Lobosporangium transversale]
MRTRLQYNNVIYSVIGEAAANVAKTSWEKLVDSKVVKPLGLKNTGYGQMGMRRQSNNHALAHFAYSFDDLINGKIEIKDLDPIYMARAPAGDMFSNVLDLIRWGQVIMNSGQLNGKQVLSKESIERMVTGHTYAPNPDPDFAPTRAYGLGMGISSYKGKTFFSHSGGVSGFQANLLIFPNDKVIIASLSNILPSTPATYLPYYIADHLFGLPTTKDWLAESVRENKLYYEFVQDELKGASLPPQIRDKPPTRPLIDFAGTYENPIHGSITIRLESEGGKGESLFFNINQFDSKMDHYHYDSFKFILNDDGIVISTLLTFQTNADGNISFQVNFPEGLCQFEKANL